MRRRCTLCSRARPPLNGISCCAWLSASCDGALAGVMIDAIGAAAGLAVGRYAEPPCARKPRVSRELRCWRASAKTFQLGCSSPLADAAQTASVDEALKQRRRGIRVEDGRRASDTQSIRRVRIYTRSLNETAEAVPEIVGRCVPWTRAAILDGEAIAFDADRPHPFQITMRRFGPQAQCQASRAELPIRGFSSIACTLTDKVLRIGPRERIGRWRTSFPHRCGCRGS